MLRKYMLFLWIAIGLASIYPFPVRAQEERQVILLTASGPITPAMAEYLDRGLGHAERELAEALVFQLDTPGGSIDLMNRMVQRIRNSQVPVVIYIAPRGAIAGSAGTVITLAGHVAAMAPETAIGAASPVGAQGEDLGETIEAKQKEILKATVRSLASRRGEQAIALAEATIEAATAVSAEEALEAGLIDFIATDLDDLLVQLNGFTVELSTGERTLNTVGVGMVEVAQSFIEQLLQVLTNPNVVFLLITVGVQAILIEISAPGGWVAGFIGVACLALGTYGLGILPVNWFGLVFMVTAFVLFWLEIEAPTYGALTVAGLASFIVGALVLFNSPTTPSFQRVSVPLVIGVAVAIGLFFMTVITFALKAMRRPVEVGVEALIGRLGEARTDIAPRGMVQVAGELWSAEVEDGELEVRAGERVEVVGVEGLRLSIRSVVQKIS
ncbi:MAG: nodulation protein NfeD [Anaerolineales bacterium]|nr:MAG: nodulation protein NfeD [Anaerolineales bacterium]